MLIEARIENHRSIREEQVLTMEAAPIGDVEDTRPRVVEGYRRPLLPAAALYGANASGKSNWLKALSFMRDAVVDSHRLWSPSGGVVARQPFAWGEEKQAPTLCETTFLLDGVRYQYGFVVDDEQFLEEWIYAWPRGRKQTWLERDERAVVVGEKLTGEKGLVEAVLRPNALYLSTAAQLSHPQLMPLYRWFTEMRTPNKRLSTLASLVKTGINMDPGSFQGLQEHREAVVELLRLADLGITDLKLEEVEAGAWQYPPRLQILIRHHASEEAWLSLAEESSGTQALLDMGPLIFDVLAAGSILFIDELGASLHPLLASHVIRLFNDPATNPSNAQLIFATHDTHLLGTLAGEPLLRRDQVWLTEKDGDGGTVLYPLTDFRPRKSENLERGYLQGRYGAIPFLGDLARASA